jgi:hypothetical protein
MDEELRIPETTGLRVKESTKVDLLTAAKWSKFLCVVGCIGVVIIVIFAIFLLGAGSVASAMFSDMPYGAVAMGVLYLIIAALYIYPLIKGFQFANGAKAACLSNDENELARGIKGLSSLTKFCGILTIICLVIYAFVILFALIGVGFAAMNS